VAIITSVQAMGGAVSGAFTNVAAAITGA